MPDEPARPAPPSKPTPAPFTNLEDFLFATLAELLEETNSEIAGAKNWRAIFTVAWMYLKAASRAGVIPPTPLRDEVDHLLDRTAPEFSRCSTANMDSKPWKERATLMYAGVDPREQWADSYREEQARIAPMAMELVGMIFGTGVAQLHRPAPWRIIQEQKREYGIMIDETEIARIEEVKNGSTAHGDHAAPPVPHAKLRPRYGQPIRSGTDPVRPGKARAGRGADWDIQYHGG